MVVRRIAPLSLAKVAFALYATIGLFVGLIVALVGLTGLAFGDLGRAAPLLGLALGAGAIIALPVFYGVMGFLVGLVSAAVYNLAAGIVGGVEVELQ